MNPKCKVCEKNKSPFIMNNRVVCMRCDELLFDIELECDEMVAESDQTRPTSTQPVVRTEKVKIAK